jgi:hypothetical protein
VGVGVGGPPPPPETKNFYPDLSFYFFSRIQRVDPFCKFKSQIFISPFLGMSYRRCHQSQQDGHHYNDLLCRTENLRNDFSRK